MLKDKQLIFLISLPRSGSTLLQKMLTANKEVTSVAEPWIMLPLIYMTKKQGVKAIYSHKKSVEFINDLIQELPNKNISFQKHLRKFVLSLYSDLNKEETRFFLDKTPRYYRIIPELYTLFPTAKFIILTRHPLQIYSSIVTSSNMCNGDISKLDWFFEDLFLGFKFLANGIRTLGKNAFVIRYKDLTKNPQESLLRLCEYLELPYDVNMLQNWKKEKFSGSAGDTDGINKYANISLNSQKIWKDVINSSIKKKLAFQVIDHVDREDFELLGISLSQVQMELNTLKIKFTLQNEFIDLIRYTMFKVKIFVRNKILN